MPRKIEQTASPNRNFTLTTAERVQAIVQGVPAWARRLKRIEDLTAEVVQLHRAGRDRETKKRLEELVKLVEAHNAYYPMEANLPLDPETSRVMDGGEPWHPMKRPTLESIIAASDGDEPPASLKWSDVPDALTVMFDVGGETFTVRLDQEALSCMRGEELVTHVPLWNIEEIDASPLRIVTCDTETIALPFELDARADETLTTELASRFRALRSANANYRGGHE